MNCFARTLLLAAVFLAGGSAFATAGTASAVSLPAVTSSGELPISWIEFLQRPAGPSPTTPATELADCEFRPRESWHFSFTNDVVWARFVLRNESAVPVDRIVDVGHIYLGDLQFFSGENCRDLRLIEATGLDRVLPLGSRALGGFSARVNLPAHADREIYVRARSKFPLSLPIQVYTPSEFERHENDLTLMLTFYGAFVLALMLYNLILGVITRERTFFAYVFTIVSLHLFTNLAQYGVIKEHFLPSWLFLHHNVFHFAHILSLTSVTLFVSAFLRDTLPKALLNFFWSLAGLTVPLCLVGTVTDAAWVDSAMQINTTIYSLSLLVVVTRYAFTTNDRPAKYFFFAWTLLIFAWVINFFKINGLIASTPLTETLILFGASNECLLLSLAIADRIRSLTAEKTEILGNLSLMNERNSIFRQVSHDIRSPVSALNMVVSTLHELPEDRRLIIRSATQRINDIANGLLQQGQAPGLAERIAAPSRPEPVMVVALLDLIISEKRLQYRERMEIEIVGDLNRGYGLFVEISATELARVISNLVNNSVEASRGSGRVVVSILGTEKRATIVVQDNGRGIPATIMGRLGEKGFSHGKESPQSGSGLGLYHAKTTIHAAGGTFHLESHAGQGTRVEIELPRTETPTWFLKHLAVPAGATLVSVDDDQTIHQIWRGRLASVGIEEARTEHLSFTSIDQFDLWAARRPKGQQLFLIDYEFLGQTRNGLDSIELLGIANQSVLVTSRFEEPAIRRRAALLGVRILPKNLAPFVPLTIEPVKESYDAILVDDDQLVHLTWEMRAKELNKKLLTFKRPEDFLAFAPRLSPDSPLFIDMNLGPGVDGTELAEKAWKLGFTEIRLATGYEADALHAPSFIHEVVGKEPRFDYL